VLNFTCSLSSEIGTREKYWRGEGTSSTADIFVRDARVLLGVADTKVDDLVFQQVDRLRPVDCVPSSFLTEAIDSFSSAELPPIALFDDQNRI
jgi:hypothetical protein